MRFTRLRLSNPAIFLRWVKDGTGHAPHAVRDRDGQSRVNVEDFPLQQTDDAVCVRQGDGQCGGPCCQSQRGAQGRWVPFCMLTLYRLVIPDGRLLM